MTDRRSVPTNTSNRGISILPSSGSNVAPAPLIAGEDAAAYVDLLARRSDTLKPSDALEEIWGATWSILRGR